ncbi:MAG TPA: alpha-N-acetylglucosaminidase [Pontiellaceae bacterium]|nr:alpha-N-acetylglucosaminidase [Pontiellaceae bacterium]
MRTVIKLLSLLMISISLAAAAAAAPEKAEAAGPEAVKALIQRMTPGCADRFAVEFIPPADGKDVYEIESGEPGRIVLRGSSGVAAASAYYHYLKEFCRCHVSWNGDQLNLPAVLPAVSRKIRVVSPVQTRLAYNYCTHGYSMVWWDWAQWERELDWLALHGINTALIIQGQDAVWQNTFARFGYTKEEIRQWLCSPIYQPWQFMQNMERVEPPPQSLIDKRVELGRKIISRCRELGIEPVLQGYFGMLPSGFKEKYPDARIVAQGGWAGGNRRPDMLHIKDPRFEPIAIAFLEEQRKLFGECRMFAADPFHEGGKPGDMKRGDAYKAIQEIILKFDPNAVVVKQCWQTSNKEMFDAGNKSRTLALDLYCDNMPFWPKCQGYDGTPWVWSLLHNFGGNIGMEGNLPRMANDIAAVFSDSGRGALTGLAIVPEGTQQNPVVYELMTEMGWRGAPADIEAWVRNYIHSRYGKANPSAAEAWNLMLQSNYAITSGQSPVSSVIVAAPRLDPNIKGRKWSSGSKILYPKHKLYSAWKKMQAASTDLGAADTYRFDLADVARQSLCNLARDVYDRMSDAYKARDLEGFKKQSATLLGIIGDLETLTATRREWLMGKWVADALQWGGTEDEKTYLDRNARLLLTTWLPNPNTALSDYASREWSGLLGEYYYTRWSLFVKALTNDLEGTEKFSMDKYAKDRAAFEVKWINGRSPLRSAPAGDTVAVSAALLAKYGPLMDEIQPAPLTPKAANEL